MPIQIKRIYDDEAPSDGIRILVDRLWPRGVSKERADLDERAKVLAPSTDLREWFGHEPEKFDEFAKRYGKELDASPEAQKEIHKIAEESRKSMVTLLYADKDTKYNNAVVLKDYIENLPVKK